jgi:hypothetical protein
VSDNKKRTAEEIADELTEIVVGQLDKLSPKEREQRIVALEKRVAAISRRKGVAADSTSSSSSCTRPTPAYARDRERS